MVSKAGGGGGLAGGGACWKPPSAGRGGRGGAAESEMKEKGLKITLKITITFLVIGTQNS